MRIGIPRERKNNEYRVALTPDSVKNIVGHGHDVLVEKNAGEGSGIDDTAYEKSGASIVSSEEQLFKNSELIVKVKEPQPEEYEYIKKDHILFCYLHLAAASGLKDVLVKSGTTAVAFETVQLDDGTLPLLLPMSRIAGRLSVQVGISHLERYKGGKGILMSGVPGVKPARVLIIGGGTVGLNAANIAAGLGATVTIIDKDPGRLEYIFDRFEGGLYTLPSYTESVRDECARADLVIGSVLVPGKRAPVVITRSIIDTMEPGTVFVDVSIDQGGCSETSRPTTHDDPVYRVNDIIHYCVTNIPSLVSKTASFYLSNEILPYVLKIADTGLEDDAVRRGINVQSGELRLMY